MSEAQSKPPRFVKGPAIGVVDKLNQLSDWAWRNRTIFSERFTTTQTAAGKVVDLAGSGASSSTTTQKFAVVTSTVSAASSQATYPVTYGSGSVKLDIDGGSTATQDTATTTVKNRWPVSFATGDLLLVFTNDGTTWYVANRYCP